MSEIAPTRPPSRLCADEQDFSTWLRQVSVTVAKTRYGAPYDKVVYPIQLGAPLKENEAPTEHPQRRIYDPTVAECLDVLRPLFQPTARPDGAQDPYSVNRNLNLLITTFIDFYRAVPGAALRFPVDRILNAVFEASMLLRREAAVPLPNIDMETRNRLRLAPNSHARIDNVIYNITRFQTSDLPTKLVNDAADNPSLAMLPRDCATFPQVAIPDFIVGYKKEKELDVLNQVLLDMSIALVFRRHMNLTSRPVHGVAILRDRWFYFYGEWKDGEAIIMQYAPALLARFEQWITFYISMIKIREKIDAVPLSDIKLSEILKNDPLFPASVPARKRKSSTRPNSPNKKSKTGEEAAPNPPAGGEADEQAAGAAGEDDFLTPGDTDDDESSHDSPLSHFATPGTHNGILGPHDSSPSPALVAPAPLHPNRKYAFLDD